MTAAQKKVADNFKKALAIRKKTGCSLKDAFAKVYGKKTAVKKAAPKKVAKKRIAGELSRVGKNLADRLWDNCDSDVADQFTDAIQSMIGIGRDIGFTFAQTMAAIKGNVEGVGNFYEDDF